MMCAIKRACTMLGAIVSVSRALGMTSLEIVMPSSELRTATLARAPPTNLNFLPIFDISGSIRRSSEASGEVLTGRYVLESSKECPTLPVDAASMAHPSKKRKERATTPVEAASELIVKKLGEAYDMDHTCKSPAFIQKLLEIRKFYQFIPNSGPISTYTSETYDSAQLPPAAPKGNPHSGFLHSNL